MVPQLVQSALSRCQKCVNWPYRGCLGENSASPGPEPPAGSCQYWTQRAMQFRTSSLLSPVLPSLPVASGVPRPTVVSLRYTTAGRNRRWCVDSRCWCTSVDPCYADIQRVALEMDRYVSGCIPLDVCTCKVGILVTKLATSA